MAPLGIRLRKIALGVGAALSACAAAVLFFAWRSMSFEITAAPPAETEKTHSLLFDDFSIDMPESFRLDNLSVSLNWPEARISVTEHRLANREAALSAFEQSKSDLTGKYPDVVDVSGRMGFPAVLLPRYPRLDLPDRPCMFLTLLRENTRLSFTLMSPTPPEDPGAWEELLLGRARDFLRFYRPGPDEGAAPPEAAGMRARHGTVEPGPREGYAFTVGLAAFNRGGQQSFSIHTITEGERTVRRPGFDPREGKIVRFFKNLSATGVAGEVGIKELSLNGRPGYEIISRSPYLDDENPTVAFVWEDALEGGLYARMLTLSARNVAAADLPALYGRWQHILESVRFENPDGQNR